jgi:hypothetical protein
MLSKALQIASANAGGENLYIEDVFSTYLYTGNNSTQTITNGIDLAGEGGLVWLKGRTFLSNPAFYDTVRGIQKPLFSNLTSAQDSDAGGGATSGLYAFNSNGFTLGTNWSVSINSSGQTFASWTFRKAEKFFDVVTYTGNGANRTIAHNLGSVPACIIVKRTDSAAEWTVYHRGIANTNYLALNTTAASALGTSRWDSTTPTASVFTLGSHGSVNGDGSTYVAYLFAHDAGGFGDDGNQNVISCGSFTSNASDIATIDLGYEPQFVMMKSSSATGHWWMADNMRGFTVDGENYLRANSSAEEAAGTNMRLTNTGFYQAGTTGAATTYIYIAIRRPMKVPESGTEVFTPVAYTGNNTSQTLTTGFATDATFLIRRNNDPVSGNARDRNLIDKLRGTRQNLFPNTTSAESAYFSSGNIVFNNTQVLLNFGGDGQTNATGGNFVLEAFRRAPSFFDVVCYTGTGVVRTVSHNLTVAPELMIIKRRNATSTWPVWSKPVFDISSSGRLLLNETTERQNSSALFNSTAPTNTVFTLGTSGDANSSGGTYVAYLFATCPNVSKVGSYTGNGSSQTINCGFTSGSRFIMIKRTDSSGDWYVWDSARGIVAGNDPRLSLNSTAAEVTTDDSVDTDNSGFVVNQVAATNVNVNAATYIFLAIS